MSKSGSSLLQEVSDGKIRAMAAMSQARAASECLYCVDICFVLVLFDSQIYCQKMIYANIQTEKNSIMHREGVLFF